MNKCKSCEIETHNPNFCSRSCSAKYNNSKFPKRKSKPKPPKKFGRDITLGEAKYSKDYKSNGYTLVRVRARAILKRLNIKACENCGYDKHVEACHIKSVAEFDDTTILSVINDPSNLVGLCPNCHWEFDHNLLSPTLWSRTTPSNL